MDVTKVVGFVLIGVGLVLVIVQVVFSWRAAKRAQQAQASLEGGGAATMDIGSVIGGIIAELAKTLPFAATGIVLIIIGAVFLGVVPASVLTGGTPSPSAP